MLNKILLVVALSGCFALGILSVKGYDEYQTQQAAQVQAATAKQEASAKAEAERIAAEAAEKEKLQQECQTGLVAYNKLTATQQKAVTKPVCDLKQVD